MVNVGQYYVTKENVFFKPECRNKLIVIKYVGYNIQYSYVGSDNFGTLGHKKFLELTREFTDEDKLELL
jgi:hypothetical protein